MRNRLTSKTDFSHQSYATSMVNQLTIYVEALMGIYSTILGLYGFNTPKKTYSTLSNINIENHIMTQLFCSGYQECIVWVFSYINENCQIFCWPLWYCIYIEKRKKQNKTQLYFGSMALYIYKQGNRCSTMWPNRAQPNHPYTNTTQMTKNGPNYP